METFVLYDKPECPFCWKIRLALAEAELPAEIIHYQHGNAESQWLTLSPNKTVPVLQHGDVTLYESAIMLEYIADVSGRLLPQTAGEKALPRLLHRYSDMTLGVGLRKVIFEKRDKPEADWNQQRIAGALKTSSTHSDFLPTPWETTTTSRQNMVLQNAR